MNKKVKMEVDVWMSNGHRFIGFDSEGDGVLSAFSIDDIKSDYTLLAAIHMIDRATTKEYSTEYKLIPLEEMARLMCAGEVLEYSSDGLFSEYDTEASQFITYWSQCKARSKPLLNWGCPCRVYQAPKTEKRWLWELMLGLGKVTTNNYHSEDHMNGSGYDKVPGSEKEFDVDE